MNLSIIIHTTARMYITGISAYSRGTAHVATNETPGTFSRNSILIFQKQLQVDEDELRAMVQYDEDVITVANFDELVHKIQNITQVACEETSKLYGTYMCSVDHTKARHSAIHRRFLNVSKIVRLMV